MLPTAAGSNPRPFLRLSCQIIVVSAGPASAAKTITGELKAGAESLAAFSCGCARRATTKRMLGFDSLYDNRYPDEEIERIAQAQGRIVLTRDRELLKRRSVTHGCYVHALRPSAQLREIFDRLDLARSVRPFSLCLECNTPLHEIEATDKVLRALPASVREHHQRFVACDACGRVFWEGSHWRRMRAMVDGLMQQAPESS